jgi:hypothetical protein
MLRFSRNVAVVAVLALLIAGQVHVCAEGVSAAGSGHGPGGHFCLICASGALATPAALPQIPFAREACRLELSPIQISLSTPLGEVSSPRAPPLA